MNFYRTLMIASNSLVNKSSDKSGKVIYAGIPAKCFDTTKERIFDRNMEEIVCKYFASNKESNKVSVDNLN